MQKPITFGVIGIGRFGRHFVRILQSMNDVRLRAVAGSSASSIEKNNVELAPHVIRARSADEIIKDPAIDAVVIATPLSSHFSLATAALHAGKHVLLEKPMVADIVEAFVLAETVQKTRRTFMVGHQYVYNDHIRYLKEFVSGSLGKVKYLFAEHLYPGPIRPDVGCFWETAPHELAIIDFLFSPGKIMKVTGQMRDLGSGRDDFASAEILFDSGLLATIVTSWFSPIKARRMVFGGEQGMAVFDDTDAREPLKFVLHPYPKNRDMVFQKGEVVIPALTTHEPLRNELEHFIECIRTGHRPLTDIEHGVRITRQLDTIYKNM